MTNFDLIRRAWRETIADWEIERHAPLRRSALARVVATALALLRVAAAALTLGPSPRTPGYPAPARRGWSDTMTTDVRIAVRSLLRSPWFTSTAVATIALSMVLAATTFAVVDGVLFKPLPYPDADRLFAVFGAMNRRGAERLYFSNRDLELWRAVPGTRFAAYAEQVEASVGEVIRPMRVTPIDRDFFDVLGQQPFIGGFQPDHFHLAAGAARPLLLSYALWRSTFGGDRNVVGRSITSTLPYPVIVAGVLPQNFLFPSGARDVPDALVPMVLSPDERTNVRANFLRAIARLDPDVEVAATRQALTAIAQANRGAQPSGDGSPAGFENVTLESLTESLGRHERRGSRLALAAAFGLVLLACLNVAGLVAARGRERVPELSLRVALGASRRDLLRLLAVESALVGLLGGACGVALAWPALSSVSALLPATLTYLKPPAIDVRVVSFALAGGLISVIVMTLPAMASPMRGGLRGRLAGTGGGATVRNRTAGRFTLVAMQASLGMVLVLGGALLLASFIKLTLEDSGFELHNTAALSVRSPRLDDLLAEVQRTPGVLAAAASNVQVMQGSYREAGFMFPKGLGIGTNSASVTADYFDVAGIKLVDGRLPTPDEVEANRPVLVVSDLLATRAWPGESAIGKVVSQSPMMISRQPDATIIGVVSDTRLQSLDEGSSGDYYLPLRDRGRVGRYTVLIRTSGNPDLVAANVARRLRAWDSRVVILAADSLRSAVWASVKPRTFNAVLYGSQAAAALVLVAVGIAGLVATAVARRQREIGIRMALGADRHRVRRLVVVENIRPVIVGLVIGAVASYWTAELVKANLYGTTPYDWTVWSATILTVLGAATLAAYVPASRASRVDLNSVLRTE